jgi:hypothetical protein
MTASKSKNDHEKSGRVLIQNLVFLMLWSCLFALAYAQSPLYTSNQNQYFLHGLAKAGFGYLNQDWLANTLDPTPIFSKWIEISWQLIPWRPVFYLYFGILAGIFLLSLYGIVDMAWNVSKSRAQKWLTLSILMAIFSTGARYLLARGFGIEWEYLFDGGVAGQRLLGTVFQPSTFGVFLMLSIYLFLRDKKGWAVVCLLVAVTFHPTYLLSAAILTVLYMGITFWEGKEVRPALMIGIGALLGVAPILWHTLATFGGSDPVLTAEARKILVQFRIPHHAIIHQWLDASVLIKMFFVVLALFVLWKGHSIRNGDNTLTNDEEDQSRIKAKSRLFHILLWPTMVATVLTILQTWSEDAVLALLFPWRLSTWLVPLSVGLILGWLVAWSFKRFQLVRYARWIIIFSMLAAITSAAIGMTKFRISWQEKQALDERGILAFVETNKQSGEVYMIPLKMQDFRLETGAPAFIEFKSIPYKDADVLEWRRRVDITRRFYAQTRCRRLVNLAETEGFTHMILPVDHETTECKQTQSIFQDEYYGVYRIIDP